MVISEEKQVAARPNWLALEAHGYTWDECKGAPKRMGIQQ